MPVHEEVLAAANRIAAQRRDWTFKPEEIIRALPDLDESSIRTHVGSRCCVNAPPNHQSRYDYFRRLDRGKYEVVSKYRARSANKALMPSGSASRSRQHLGQTRPPMQRDVIHAVVHPDEDGYYVECLEVSVITQGKTLDDLVRNLDEALSLHLEGEDLAALGLASRPKLQLIIEKPLQK